MACDGKTFPIAEFTWKLPRPNLRSVDYDRVTQVGSRQAAQANRFVHAESLCRDDE
jgi:hypothetical protein